MTLTPNAQLTHAGLYVDDMGAMVAFYTDLLGLVVTDQGDFLGRRLTFLSRRSDEHHQLVLVSGRHVEAGTALLSQLSFRVDDLASLRHFHARATELGVQGLEGRNHGNSWSIYFEDPEGNRLEVYTPTPWYVSQPWRVPLDLALGDEEIEATTRQLIGAGATWSPVEEWRAGLADRLGEIGAAATPGRVAEAPNSGLPAAGFPNADPPYRSIWTELRQVSFRQGWLEAGGLATRYAEAGRADAPAVVLLHGTGGHWETFAANLGPLSEHFHCVAFDLVGNGFSAKPDLDYEIPVYVDHLLAVMDTLGLARASLIGVSLGSWVAARAALDHPGRVDKLVFLSTAGLIATADNMARIRAERTKAVADPSWAAIKAMFDHLIAEEHNRIPDLVALRQAIYSLPGMKDAMVHTLVLQDPETRDRNLLSEQQWRTIACPALVVASGRDHNEYENTSRRVAALMPQAQLLEMPHVKHWPHFEDPELFNAAALRFLLA